jgi:hypothetical protein
LSRNCLYGSQLPVGHDVTEFGFFGLEVLPGDAYSSLVSKRAKKVAETTEGGPVASSKPALTRDVASNSKKRKVGAVVSTEMPECVQASSDDGDVGVEDGDAVLEDATEVVGEPVEGIRAAVPTDAAKTKKKKKKKKSKKARVDPGDEAEAGNEDVGEDDVTEEAVAAVATGPWGTLGLHPLLHKAVAKVQRLCWLLACSWCRPGFVSKILAVSSLGFLHRRQFSPAPFRLLCAIPG